MAKRRNVILDIAKGIGILLVVFVHCNFLGEKNIISIISQSFFMPLFFIISGYLIKEKELQKRESNLLNILIKYFKYFVITCFINLLFLYMKRIIQGNFIELINEIIKHSVLVFLGIESEGGSWFLITLALSYTIFNLIKNFLDNKKILNIIQIFSVALSIIMYEYYHIDNILIKYVLRIIICECFIWFGYSFHSLIKKVISNETMNYISFIISMILLVSVSLLNNDGSISLEILSLNNIILYLISGIIGTIFVLNLSTIISKYSITGKNLAFFGEYSVYILITNQIIIPIIRTPASMFINNYYIRLSITFVAVVILELLFLKLYNKKYMIIEK